MIIYDLLLVSFEEIDLFTHFLVDFGKCVSYILILGDFVIFQMHIGVCAHAGGT